MKTKRELTDKEKRAFASDLKSIVDKTAAIQRLNDEIVQVRMRLNGYAMLICEEGEYVDFANNTICWQDQPEPALEDID